ncbi:MAG: hypothetical protein ACKO2G_07690 [Verrucomicrobiales bacterium]
MPPPPFQKIFGPLTMPGILRIWVGFQGIVFLLLMVRGPVGARDIYEMLMLDWDRILSGQVWRVVSFILIPPVSPFSTTGLLFMFFLVMFTFFVNDILEQAWGSRGLSAFFFTGVVACIGASSLFPPAQFSAAAYLGASALMAASTVAPRLEVRLMFVLPVPLYVVGGLAGVGLLADVFRIGRVAPAYSMVPLLAVANYLIWAVPIFTRYLAHRGETRERRARFEEGKVAKGDAFHTCESCGATEISHPDHEFRITAAGRELCNVCREEAPKS